MARPTEPSSAHDDYNPNFQTGSPQPAAPVLSLAEKMKRAAASVADYQPSKIYQPSQAIGQPSVAAADTNAAAPLEDFDPNDFSVNPLTGSVEMPQEAPAYYEEAYTSDPESDLVPSDDESRDLCSNPCVQCGTVPSYVLYELCDKCLDKFGPQ